MSAARREQIAQSWRDNAAAWTDAVRQGGIESRRLATDAAILAEVRACTPQHLLDVGCGEGWLCRAAAAEGVDCVGIDASPQLVQAARSHGGARYEVMRYEQLVADSMPQRFDVIVCNFALLDDDPVPLLSILKELLSAPGRLLLQTMHPWSSCGDAPYRDGWRQETFAAFGAAFGTPMPWYFRTLGSWLQVLESAGLGLVQLREPAHPHSGVPLSLLLVAQR